MTTTYIISLSKYDHRIVYVDEMRNQTTTPLAPDMLPAHTAFARGTGDGTIRRVSRHPGARVWTSLEELIDDSDLDADEANEACALGAPFGSARARAQYA